MSLFILTDDSKRFADNLSTEIQSVNETVYEISGISFNILLVLKNKHI